MTKRDKRARCSVDVHYVHVRLRWRFNGTRCSKTVGKWNDDAAGRNEQRR